MLDSSRVVGNSSVCRLFALAAAGRWGWRSIRGYKARMNARSAVFSVIACSQQRRELCSSVHGTGRWRKLRSMMRVVWIIALCGLAVLAAPQGVGGGDLVCTLQLNSYPYSDMTADLRSHLHFVLLSKHVGIDIYEDWNSWGFFTRTFSVTDSQSRHFEIARRPPRGWDRNFPSVTTLDAGQFLVTDIYLCDGSWRVSPRMAIPSGQKLTVIGRFKQERDDGFQLGNPWIGNIESTPVELTLSQACIGSLNSSAVTTGVVFRR
jgi:hypothetical protein